MLNTAVSCTMVPCLPTQALTRLELRDVNTEDVQQDPLELAQLTRLRSLDVSGCDTQLPHGAFRARLTRLVAPWWVLVTWDEAGAAADAALLRDLGQLRELVIPPDDYGVLPAAFERVQPTGVPAAARAARAAAHSTR